MEASFIDDEIEESIEDRSFNHATIQANLAYLLKKTGNYTVTSDLSLDLGSLDLTWRSQNQKGETCAKE